MIVIYRFNNSNATIIIPSSKKMKKKKINVESVDTTRTNRQKHNDGMNSHRTCEAHTYEYYEYSQVHFTTIERQRVARESSPYKVLSLLHFFLSSCFTFIPS